MEDQERLESHGCQCCRRRRRSRSTFNSPAIKYFVTASRFPSFPPNSAQTPRPFPARLHHKRRPLASLTFLRSWLHTGQTFHIFSSSALTMVSLLDCMSLPSVSFLKLNPFAPVIPSGPGFLPRWQLFVAATALFNTVQNFMTIKLTAKIYNSVPANAPGIRYSSAPVSRTDTRAPCLPVTALQARTFAVWTLLSTIVRGYAAYHIHEKPYVFLSHHSDACSRRVKHAFVHHSVTVDMFAFMLQHLRHGHDDLPHRLRPL